MIRFPEGVASSNPEEASLSQLPNDRFPESTIQLTNNPFDPKGRKRSQPEEPHPSVDFVEH